MQKFENKKQIKISQYFQIMTKASPQTEEQNVPVMDILAVIGAVAVVWL